MIPVANPIPEPTGFEEDCRTPGNAWLSANPHAKTSKYPNHWAQYEDELATAFQQRCGWWAMWIAEGEVEHFLSKKHHSDQTYEWSNYRFVTGSVNSSKRNHDNKVLDPFEIQSGWFEINLWTMHLKLTDGVPDHLSDKALFTIEKLHLQDGRKVIRCRKAWYRSFKQNRLTLEGLEEKAPLVAQAVKRFQNLGIPLP